MNTEMLAVYNNITGLAEQEEISQYYIDNAQHFMAEYTGISEWHTAIPDNMQWVWMHIAVSMYNNRGNEGATRTKEGGVTWDASVLERHIKDVLNRRRLVKII